MNTLRSTPRPALPLILWLGLLANCGFAAVRFLIWKASDDILELLLYFPELLAAGLVLLAVIGSLVHFVRWRRMEGSRAAAPILVVMGGALLIWAIIPGFNLPDDQNFRRYRHDREAVVALVRAGKLPKPPGSPRFRALPWRLRHVSKSGEVLVDQQQGVTKVFFFTYRGLLSGGDCAIVYTESLEPNIWGYTAYPEVEQLAPHWYRVAGEY